MGQGASAPGARTEAARLSVVQLTGDGRGGEHPSYVLGYYDAPSLEPNEHELVVWLNRNEIIGFNAASLAPVANYNRKGRAMAFTGPGIAGDWLDVEGPLHDVWPPRSHKLLFGDLPLVEFEPERNPGVRQPPRDDCDGSAGEPGQEPARPGRRHLDRPERGPSPTPTACSPPSCRGRSAGPSPRRSAGTTSSGSRVV